MPKSKWSDFELVKTVTRPCKQRGGQEELYACFKCPYCVALVQLPESNIKNNKSTECYNHLFRCNGVSKSGAPAEIDPRVASARVTAAQCRSHMQTAKRGRGEGQSSAVDSTASLRSELEEQESALQIVVRSEERLMTRNEELASRVHSLQTQMDNLKMESTSQMQALYSEMARMREEARERDVRVEGQIQTLAKALGFPTPPLPTVDQMVIKAEKILGKTSKQDKQEVRKLCKELEEKDRQIEAQNIRIENLLLGRNQAGGSAADLIRKLSRDFHPDKAAANGMDDTMCVKVMQMINQYRM